MTTIDEIKNECLGWTGLQSGNPQGQFAQRAAKAVLDLITILESIAKPALGGKQQQASAQNQLAHLCNTWEESK